MKKLWMIALASMVLTACSSDNMEEVEVMSEPTDVQMKFSPYEMSAMTRAAVSIADVVTKLDVWIYESGSEDTKQLQTHLLAASP